MGSKQQDAVCANSMTERLRRVLVCSPLSAGWSDVRRRQAWEELGYRHVPDGRAAQVQHEELQERLQAAGVSVAALPGHGDLSLDAVYAHDASLLTEWGAVCMRMGKSARSPEPDRHAALFRELGIGLQGRIEPPGTAEAGDIVWLDHRTLLVGRSYRTNREGIDQLDRLLSPRGVEVIAAPLPHLSGPANCLHLMSLMSLLDESTVLVDLPWLSIETVELLATRGFALVEIDQAERSSMACNVLALGNRRLLALRENPLTNRRLAEHGFEVLTFDGSELCQNGSGGPTCLTRPLFRSD